MTEGKVQIWDAQKLSDFDGHKSVVNLKLINVEYYFKNSLFYRNS